MEKVQLLPAFAFNCPRCDAQNHQLAERREITDDEATALADGDATERYELLTVIFYAEPDEVGCGSCGEHFKTIGLQTHTGAEPAEESLETDDSD